MSALITLMSAATRSRKKRRSSSSKDGFSLKSVEILFSKQLMRVIGILFLGASLWFAANSTDTIFKVAKTLISPKELIVKQAPATGPTTGLTILSDGKITKVKQPDVIPISFPMVLITFAMMAGWLILQLLTRWRKRIEFQIISVFLIFTSILAMIRGYGWQVELIFPLLILISAGLYLFGKHLSHTATRINFIFTWVMFSLWWLLKIMINGQQDLLPSFFIFASLLFLTFHVIQLLRGFAGRKKLSNYIEVFAIAFNIGFYFILITATILKFYGKHPLFYFTLGLAILYILSLFAMEYSGKPFRKVPFLISALVLVSFLLPLLFWKSQVILLAGSLSMLLLFYSRQTKDQPSVIIALGLVVFMALVFAKDLIFAYVPAAFTGGLMNNQPLLYRGLISGLFIALVAFVDNIMMKKLEIKFSRKWFSRRRYRMLLKGILMAGLYFGFFLVWQYSFITICGFEEVALISWFSFHCLYCIISIPWLAAHKSSLLPIAILVSVILTVVYPSLLSLQNIKLVDLYIRGIQSGLTVFPLHYIPSVLFLVYIAMILQYVGKGFKGSNIAKRIFLIYAIVMVLDVLISEMVLTGVALSATSQLEGNEIRTELLHLPATLILFAGGAVTLIWGFIWQKRFGRTLAMILLFLAAFKLIYFDLRSISLFTRVILLFASGSLFIGLSLGYAKARKAFRTKRKHTGRVRVPRFSESNGNDQSPES
ncbi:MAG: hypothetical protein IH596_03225 [Bacteroidales bacterium]|nr:hypothetical protein [Bacteroidales bacterium]